MKIRAYHEWAPMGEILAIPDLGVHVRNGEVFTVEAEDARKLLIDPKVWQPIDGDAKALAAELVAAEIAAAAPPAPLLSIEDTIISEPYVPQTVEGSVISEPFEDTVPTGAPGPSIPDAGTPAAPSTPAAEDGPQTSQGSTDGNS